MVAGRWTARPTHAWEQVQCIPVETCTELDRVVVKQFPTDTADYARRGSGSSGKRGKGKE